MHVAGLSGVEIGRTNQRWTGAVTITIQEVGSTTGVASATVSGTWSGGAKGGGSCVTDGTGSCSVSKAAKLGQSMTFTVTNVTHATLSYVQQGGDILDVTIAAN